MRWSWLGIGVCVASSWLSHARAADPTFDVAYTAPSSCPTVEGFRSAVSNRAPAFPWSPTGERFSVEIQYLGTSIYTGRAAFPTGLQREVKAVECRDVVSALALISVVTLSPSTYVPASDAAPAVASAVETGDQTPRSGAEDPGVPHAWRQYFGLFGGVYGSRAPGVMPVVGIFADIKRETEPWQLSVYAALEAGQSRHSVSNGLGEATFSFLGAELGTCPLALFGASLCVLGEGGVLRVSTDETLSNGSEDRPWFALGLQGKYALELESGWLIQIRGGVVVPLTRDRFQIRRLDGGLDTIHEPELSGSVGLGVGYRL